jgi:hypothetical protein
MDGPIDRVTIPEQANANTAGPPPSIPIIELRFVERSTCVALEIERDGSWIAPNFDDGVEVIGAHV